MTQRFWIVGGDYSDTSFRDLKPGSQTLAGPFADYDRALSQWRQLAEASRHNATARYTIAVEQARA
ncbi:MAG: DUF4170 domain-containing protein [Azospirillaceae bacterium]